MRPTRLPLLVILAGLLPFAPPSATARPRQAAETAPPAADTAGDLIAVARREAERERAFLTGKIQQLLTALQSSADPTQPAVESQIAELAAMGNTALPQLLAAISGPTATSSTNEALNAARAVARIPGQEASAAIARLATASEPRGRWLAALAVGSRGDASLLPVVKELAQDSEPQVVVEALRAIGRIGGGQALELLVPRIQAENADVAAAAITGLQAIGDAATDQEVVTRLATEFTRTPPAETIQVAALAYLTQRPVDKTVPLLARCLSEATTTPRVRESAVAALLALGTQDNRLRPEVITALREGLKFGPKSVIDAAAMAMNDLGDESGIKAVTAELDAEIDSNAKNYNVRYKRAEVYLRFQKWKYAKRDFEAGLKIEKQPRDPERVYVGMARASAGMGAPRDAVRHLKKLGEVDLSDLPQRFVEFRDMAADPRYERTFAKPD